MEGLPSNTEQIKETTPRGKRMEEELLPAVYTEWQGEQWIMAREAGDRRHEDEIFHGWLEKEMGLSRREWNSIPGNRERADLLLRWVRDHQPSEKEGWETFAPRYVRKDEQGNEKIDERIYNFHNKILENLEKMKDFANPTRTLDVDDLDGEGNTLTFITVRESPADTLYGIDGAFAVGDAFVTVDFTMNEEKKAREKDRIHLGKADSVITYDELEDPARLELLSKELASVIMHRVEEAKRQMRLAG